MIDYYNKYDATYKSAMYVLKGYVDRCDITKANDSDLVDLIGISDHPELIARWFALALEEGDTEAIRMMNEWIEEVIDGLE